MSSALLEWDAEREHRLPRSQHGRARHLVAAATERDDQAEPLGARQQLRVGLPAEALGQLAQLDDLGLLGVVRREQRLREAEDLLGRATGAIEQVLDRGEVIAVALQLLDQPQARGVIGPVVAGARANLWRRQQPARLVGPDVADGHARLAGELVDRH